MPSSLYIPSFKRAFEATGRPRLMALERLVARARRLPDASSAGFLAPLFGLVPEVLAAAPFTRLADGGRPDEDWWLRADPVHLAPDRDRLVLMPERLLQVSMEEATGLAALFNQVYGGEGWELEFHKPSRGYLRSPTTLSVTTHDPEELAGAPVLEAMPEGRHAGGLKQLMNETQMLFHDHPVNKAREEDGRPIINSLWFWGGGALPPKSGQKPAQIVSDLLLVKGLARWAGVASQVPGMGGSVDVLMAFEGTDLPALERKCFGSLFSSLKSGEIPALDMYLGGLGVFRVDSAAARRFWRPGRRLSP